MAQRELKVTITVRQGRTAQTMHVRAAGRRGSTLLGKVVRVQQNQTLTTTTDEVLFVSQLLTLADALVLS